MGNAAPSFDWSAWRVHSENRSGSGKRSATSKPIVLVRRVRTTSDNGPPWTVRCNRDVFAIEESTATAPQYAILRSSSIPRNIELVSLVDECENPLQRYLLAETCYNVIPARNSVICTDSTLSLLHTVLRLTPYKSFVYDKSSGKFCSILTNTDYLAMMQLAFDSQVYDTFVLENVAWWLQNHGDRDQRLISVKCNQSLKHAVEVMIDHKIHHVAVTDSASGDILNCFNLNTVMILLKRQLHATIFALSWMQQSLFTSGIIEWNSSIAITSRTTFKNALRLILAQKLTSLPIVDDKGVLVDVLCKKEMVRAIADFAGRASSELFASLCMQTVGETIEGDVNRMILSANRMLTPSDTVGKAFRFFGSNVYRQKCVYVVNNAGKLLGSVSLLAYTKFLLQADRKQVTSSACDLH